MTNYNQSQMTKAFRVRDGQRVEVPKRWLQSGSPFKDAYTTTDPAKAAEKSASDGGGNS